MKIRSLIFPLVLLLAMGGIGCNLISPKDSEKNAPPTIAELEANLDTVCSGGSCIITCSAIDPNNDELFYIWNATAGSLRSTINNAVLEAPKEIGTITITVSVSDIWGAATSKSIAIPIVEKPDTLASKRILVDASHDGGVWWFPQSSIEGFSPDKNHQGQALANRMRNLGYEVDELARGTTITSSLLNQYDKVIRAGNFGLYADAEILAYQEFVGREAASLILISEFLRPGTQDNLAEALGLPFRGMARGWVANFKSHPITELITPFIFNAGSVLLDPDSNADIEVLGRLRESDFVDLNGNETQDPDEPKGSAVMGILHTYPARVFFLGEINGIELVPQPFVDNLVAWAFGPGE